jgi:anti-anti-sigma factor
MLLRIDTEMEGDTLRVTLAGEFDASSVEPFREAVEPDDPAWDCVALDMRDVTFMDSSALGELVRLDRRARELRGQLTLVRPSSQVRALLELTGLAAEFAVRD